MPDRRTRCRLVCAKSWTGCCCCQPVSTPVHEDWIEPEPVTSWASPAPAFGTSATQDNRNAQYKKSWVPPRAYGRCAYTYSNIK
ncbi:unnamed protein product [Pieris macdunnoughi]|uniref:Uncharacterized protein n=1 Tax=Pieris macdunnoughi TaxID=345717 RepID=A0A821UBL6_9NEOP|nr:unnamed protein product [Pieris macdunnoughi]